MLGFFFVYDGDTATDTRFKFYFLTFLGVAFLEKFYFFFSKQAWGIYKLKFCPNQD